MNKLLEYILNSNNECVCPTDKCDDSKKCDECWKKCFEEHDREIYNKAIDDFVEWLGGRLAVIHLFPEQRAKLYADILTKSRELKAGGVIDEGRNS